MSNDNKTLADVQPGGRVRLGDSLPPLPGPRVTGYDFDSVLRRVTMTGYTAEQMQDYARAALSAQPSPGATALGLPIVVDPTMPPDTFEVRQPSPGGQGDALAMIGANLRSILSLAAKMGGGAHPLTVANIHHEADHALQLLAAALAARQPVDELHDEIEDAPHSKGECENCGECSVITLCTGCKQPAQAVDLGQIWQQAFNDTAHSYRRNKSRMWVLQILKERVQALIDSQALGK